MKCIAIDGMGVYEVFSNGLRHYYRSTERREQSREIQVMYREIKHKVTLAEGTFSWFD